MDSNGAPKLRLSGVSANVNGRQVLDCVDLVIEPGEIHGLVNRQHDERSMLCKAITGELPIQAGRILLSGTDITNASQGELLARGVEYTGGQPMLQEAMTVAENLALGGEWSAGGIFTRRSLNHEIQAWLDAEGFALDACKRVSNLPYSDFTYIEILNRLRRKPSLLVIDESLDRLSEQRRGEILAAFRRNTRERGMSVLWTANEVEYLLLQADRISVMRENQIILTDKVANLNQLYIIRLCYDQLSNSDVVSRPEFYELMHFIDAALSDVPTCVLVMDPDRRVRFCNHAAQRLFSLEGEKVTNKSLLEVLGGNNLRLHEVIMNAAAECEDFNARGIVCNEFDRRKIADVKLRVIRDRHQAVGHLLSIDDVSDAEHIRQRAMVSENLKNIGLLAAGVAHEVNNPLEIMTNLISYLRLTNREPQTVELLGKIEAEAERIQRIVDNLVLFSGRRDRPVDTMDIRLLIGETLDLLGFHVRDMNIEFSFRATDKPLLINADHNEMRQVFLNLLRNSIEALKERGGHIRIAAEEVREFDQTKVRITMEDDGPGIRLEHVEDVFLPFVSDKLGDGPNQGLGLSIVYNLVREHGGIITVANLPHAGCRFVLEFPTAPV
ncbi:MAG: ATP-binding protein [Planctomycetaceae bacterium]|nr:ATP-binding protein [Planctomycetaceae bacterium]